MADSYVIRQGTERNTNPMFMEIMAKDLTELAKYASKCTPGSLGYLEDATVYRLGTQGTWVKVGEDVPSRLNAIAAAIAPVTSQLAAILTTPEFTVDSVVLGSIEDNTGRLGSAVGRIRTKDFIEVSAGDVFEFKTTLGGTLRNQRCNFWEYDYDGNYIGTLNPDGSHTLENAGWKNRYTVTQDCLLKIMFESAYTIDGVITYPSVEEFIAALVPVSTGGSKPKISVDAFDYKVRAGVDNILETKADLPYVYPKFIWGIGSVTGSTNVDPTRNKTTPILGRGIVSVDFPNKYRATIRVWEDAPYGTMLYDSDWQTSSLTYDVTGKYYAVAVHDRASSGTVDIDPAVVSQDGIVIREALDNWAGGVESRLSVVEDRTSFHIRSGTVRTIAHRGDDIVAPQCVAPAYIAARRRGHTIAENDLMVSLDGEYVMWHDTTLSRLGTYLSDINGYHMYADGTDFYWYDSVNAVLYTYDDEYIESSVNLSALTRCTGASYTVASLPLSILKRIDFGVYKGVEYKGTQILTFEEWVLLCKQLGMEIYIDRKIAYTESILTDLVNILKSYGMLNFTSWLGLSTDQITFLRSLDPNARVGVLAHPDSSNIVTYAPYNTGRGFFFNGDAKNGMTKEVIQLGLNAGFEVEVWYVDFSTSEEETFNVFRTAVSYGVTGITTDHYRVDEAFKYLLE
jgi:glycerophosphoryl diester phosphodiesterase